MNFKELQDQQMIWAEHNFPNAKPYQPLLGAVEELGELAHAHLKMEQGIRNIGYESKTDAIADIVIYLAHYCSLNDIDMNDAICSAWKIVQERNWKKFPKNGKTE
jgi:NTP pyrophosphatase (non-canonical NTP hydrolase)